MAKLICKGLALVIIGAAVWIAFKCCTSATLPQINPDEWWGQRELQGKQDTSVKPFRIIFDDAMIRDLKYRLKNHRPFTPPLEGVGFEYGFNSKLLNSWLNYWANEYPFAEREKYLNQFPQFKTNIQGLDIHFIRVKPKAAVRPGSAPPYMGNIFRLLMQRLGHKKFYIQGGDWGAIIGDAMTTLYPDDVLGYHSNLPFVMHPCGMIKTLIGAFIPSLVVEEHLADRMYPLSGFFAFVMEEFGYSHLQATKPDTIGIPLTDSPAGLLAYILENFSTWTRRENKLKVDGGLETKFSRDQLLDNLMIYWSTNSITTAMRLYAENFSRKNRDLNIESISTRVPSWLLQTKNELTYQPPAVYRTKFTNLLNVTVVDDGGHFIAFEMPQVYAEDVFKAVKAFREWHKNTARTDL